VPPFPPNRTGGSPASGSPVDGLPQSGAEIWLPRSVVALRARERRSGRVLRSPVFVSYSAGVSVSELPMCSFVAYTGNNRQTGVGS
jgi:hypothetical protein